MMMMMPWKLEWLRVSPWPMRVRVRVRVRMRVRLRVKNGFTRVSLETCSTLCRSPQTGM